MLINLEDIKSSENRYRLGTTLLWMGILTWVPFILLRVSGTRVALLWFLPFHLIGVIGGARLRSAAREDLGIGPVERSPIRVVAHGMIFVGILVWIPYFYLKLVAQTPVEVARFLPYHLVGVLGGATLLVLGAVRNWGAS
jgi:hypothetical protein